MKMSKRINLSLMTCLFAMSLFFVSCGNETTANAAEKASDGLAATTGAVKDAAATGANAVADAAKAAADAVPVGPTTTIEFEESEYDFGVIDEGEKAAHVYKFKNTGTEPLIISNAKGSCGCTVPQWPKDPIAPGESGEINVEFNSKNKKGKQSKRVTITANTDPGQTFLTIKGEVTPDPVKEAEKAAAEAAKAAPAN